MQMAGNINHRRVLTGITYIPLNLGRLQSVSWKDIANRNGICNLEAGRFKIILLIGDEVNEVRGGD